MPTREPTILSVVRMHSQGRYVPGRNPVYLDLVDGRMNDGTVQRLYAAPMGEIILEDDNLIGLTVEQARGLAESCGPILP